MKKAYADNRDLGGCECARWTKVSHIYGMVFWICENAYGLALDVDLFNWNARECHILYTRTYKYRANE